MKLIKKRLKKQLRSLTYMISKTELTLKYTQIVENEVLAIWWSTSTNYIARALYVIASLIMDEATMH